MCLFCNIINGKIPSTKLYEDEDVLAILDISQATKGHTLVMPKKHFDSLYDIEDYEYLKVMNKVKDLAKVIPTTFGAKGCNILNNCQEVAGQTIMHFHVHIIPRYEEKDVNFEFKNHNNDYDLIQLAEKIKKNL